MWRTTTDIADGWQFSNPSRFTYPVGVLDAINFAAADPNIQQASGPGGWNSPDYLMTGVDLAGSSNAGGKANGLNYTEERTQVSFSALLFRA